MTTITRYFSLLFLAVLALSACNKASTGPLFGKHYVANADKDRFPMFNASFIEAKNIKTIIGTSPKAKQKEVFSFDTKGNITTHIMIEASDTLDTEYYFYNTAGKLIQYKKHSGARTIKKYYFYDEAGQLDFIEQQLNYPNDIALSGRATLFTDIVYTYENGRCMSKANHNSEELDIYSYQDKGLITSVLSTSLFKNIPDTLGLLQWDYDDANRFSQLDMLFVNSPTKRFIVRIVPTYDAEGRLIKVSRYNSYPSWEEYQLVGDFLFVYDTKGKLTRIQAQEKGQPLKVLQSFEYKFY